MWRKHIVSALFILIAFTGYSQIRSFHWLSSTRNKPVNSGVVGTADSVRITHPSIHYTFRDGVQSTITYDAPTGYGNLQWEIIQHFTRTVVASGTGKTISWTPTFNRTKYNRNGYALHITGTKASYPNLTFLARAEIVVAPVKFTEGTANLVIDLATGGIGSYNGAIIPHSGGYKIWVKNTYTGSSNLNFFSWAPSGTNYVHVAGDFQINSQNRSLQLGGVDNFIFDGAISEAVPFGIRLTKVLVSTSSTSKNLTGITGSQTWTIQTGLTVTATTVRIYSRANPSNFAFGTVTGYVSGTGVLTVNVTSANGSGSFTDWDVLSGGSQENFYYTPGEDNNVMILGMSIDNGSNSYGSSGGFVVQMINTANDDNNNFLFHRIKVSNTGGEGIYDGHTRITDSPHYGQQRNVLLSHIQIINSGNDGIQIGGCHNCELMRWSVSGSGLSGTGGQLNILQFAHGNDSLFVQAGKGITASGDIHFNVTGQAVEVPPAGITEISNCFLETTIAGQNYNTRMEEVTGNVATQYLGFFNNTVRAASSAMFKLYKGAGSSTVFNPLYFDANLVLDDDVTPQYTVFDGLDVSHLTMNNYATTNVNAPLFFNAGSKDYRIATITSPTVDFTTTTVSGTRLHPWSVYDYYGYGYVSGHLIAGADGGFLMRSGVSYPRNISSVASIADINDVPNGTSFALLQSSFLPTQVTVTNSDGSTRLLTITWIQGTYNGSVAGTYALAGTLTLPADITNTGVLTALVNVEVDAAGTPVLEQINIGGNTQSGWFAASTSPVHATNTINYGSVGSSGITLHATNSTNTTWTGSSTSSGGSAGTTYPDNVQLSYFFTQATNGANLELRSVPSNVYTIDILGSRTSITTIPGRITYYTIGGVTKSVNVASVNNNGNDTLVTFTGVTAVAGVITINVKGDGGNGDASNAGHINAIVITSVP